MTEKTLSEKIEELKRIEINLEHYKAGSFKTDERVYTKKRIDRVLSKIIEDIADAVRRLKKEIEKQQTHEIESLGEWGKGYDCGVTNIIETANSLINSIFGSELAGVKK